MKKLGQFIEKKKVESRFKKAGAGHSLQEERKIPESGPSAAPVRANPSQSSQQAGQKALERFDQKQQSSKPKRNFTVLKSQVKQEATNEAQAAAATSEQKSHVQNQQPPPTPTFSDQDAPISVAGVFYQCPLCSTTASQSELTAHMEVCFATLVSADPLQGTCTMINSINRDFDALKIGKDILCKYVDNIYNHPGEDKYRKIRIGNKAFQERVVTLKGGIEFLQAVGFQQKELPHQDATELFWVLPEEFAQDMDRLISCKTSLESGEAMRPTLWRDLKILKPVEGNRRFHLPDEFFRITSEEVKREQERRKEIVEKSEQLRTKAMKLADEQNEKRQYRYSLIRVRFPDGYVLQGTFHARDRFSEVIDFVRSCLVNDWQPFVLSDPTGPLLAKERNSLLQLKLAPAAQLTFAWDRQILSEITAAQGSVEASSPLKPELLASSQTL
ncbi:UBX domain-containing protein 6-like [Apostichopus japonicus]|uniref:UBX domain-containing protein 6-like n=1 Tax=Stichopus japonicus TaxID=307972 RepID=UPI003AB18565